jgi:hypothetical protein
MKKMKTRVWQLCFVTLAIVCLAVFMACPNTTASSPTKEALQFFESNPTTIYWQGDAKQSIEAFQADVEVYTMNNRKDVASTLSDKYRMSLKKIDDVQYIRLDFDPAFNENRNRSVISNGTEMVLFNTKTEEVEYRLTLEPDVSKDLSFLSLETALSRLNLSHIKSESQRLAFDMNEEGEGMFLCIDLPSHLFASSPDSTRLSTRVTFDTQNETLQSVEIASILEDGTEVVSYAQPVYEEKNGEPVKVGTISIIDYKAPSLIEDFDPEIEIYESYDDIPTLSEEQLEVMLAEGSITESMPPVFGNPADLSYQSTVIELYREISINSVSDATFRLLLGGN